MKTLKLAAIGSTLALSVGAAQAADPPTIRIGWNQIPGHIAGLAWHDTSLGYLKNHGKTYNAKPIYFQGSGHQVTALAADQVDIAAVNPVAFTSIIQKAKLDAVIVGDVLHTPCDGKSFAQPFYARKEANIKTLADLKGKKIAINSQGSGHDMSVLAAVTKGGLTKDDVTRIEMKFSSMVPFLKEGKVDVGGYLPQFVKPIKDDPNLVKIFDSCVAGPVASVILAAKKDFIEKNRAAMVDMFADQMRAIQFLFDPKNREKALDLVAKATKAPKSNFADYVFTNDDYRRAPDMQVNPEFIQNSIEQGVAAGRAKSLKAADYVDYSVAKAAAKQVFGK